MKMKKGTGKRERGTGWGRLVLALVFAVVMASGVWAADAKLVAKDVRTAAAFAANGPLLLPDYNRDGKINEDDYDRLGAGEAFTVWLNDDDDAEGTNDGEEAGDTNVDLHDVPGGDGNDQDCADDKVNGRCDLLDFFPVLIDVNLARINGTEYATVAEAVAAADGQPIRLLHAASWKPTAPDVGKPIRFLNKSSLVVDRSALPAGYAPVWTDVDGNDGTLTLKIVAADTVVYGTIRTAAKGNAVAGAIAIKDGKYVYVGDEAGAAAFVEDGVTKVVDHRGKGMVMPGCTDGHSHYTMKFGLANMKGGILFDISDNKAAVLGKVEAVAGAAQAAGKTCIFGFGWNLVALRVEDPPTLKELDDVSHGLSMVIFAQGGHHAYCNSECLKRCGIIDGEGNVLITEIKGGLLELDEKGYPTGFVDERVTGYLMRMGGINYDEIVDDEVAEASIRASQELLLSTGYTTALEGWSNVLHPSKFYEVANRLDKGGELKLVLPMTYEVEPWQTEEAISNEIRRLDSLNKTYGTEHVRPEYLKVFMDGCVESMTGAMLKPYKDGTEYKSFWSVDRLADITGRCNAKGLTVHAHVMGDAAIRDLTDAYISGGDGTHRNCMVHLRHVRKDDYQRFADNNIACSAGFTWHVSSKEMDDLLKNFLDDEYIKHAYPMKSFFDAGVRVSSHSDFPANEPSPQDPFGIMQVALAGLLPDSPEEAFDTAELVTVEQVFEALTLNGAWQLGLENERGSIAVGKWADFVLADQDVFACAVNEIGKTKVVSTWFEGEMVYQAAEPPMPSDAFGTVTYPKANASTGLVKEGSSATWKAKAGEGCVFAGWKWTNGTPAAAFAALSENERRNPTLKLKIAAGEHVRPTNVTAAWAWIDEDRILSVELTPSGLAVVCRSCVKAAVSGLPSGLKFDKKTLAITGTAKKDEAKTVKVSVKNASGYTWKQSFGVTVAGGAVTATKPADDQALTGEPVVLRGDAALGKVKGAKVYAAGKKASVRATPAKGSIFLGWYEDAAFANAATNLPKGCLADSQSVVVPSDGLKLYARFVELGAWTVGTFDGVCYEMEGGTKTVASGTVTFTVSEKGKVSGKTLTDGRSYSFKANAFDDAFETKDEGLVFVAHPTMKVAGVATDLTLLVFENTSTGLGAAELRYGEEADAPFAAAVQNGWKLKPSALPELPTGKAALEVSVTNGVDLKLKFGAKGVVRAAGTVDGAKVSSKTQMLPVAWRSTMTPNLLAQVPVYVAPTRNATGFCAVYDVLLTVGADGEFDEASLPAPPSNEKPVPPVPPVPHPGPYPYVY